MKAEKLAARHHLRRRHRSAPARPIDPWQHSLYSLFSTLVMEARLPGDDRKHRGGRVPMSRRLPSGGRGGRADTYWRWVIPNPRASVSRTAGNHHRRQRLPTPRRGLSSSSRIDRVRPAFFDCQGARTRDFFGFTSVRLG